MSNAAIEAALAAPAPAKNPVIALDCSRADGERLLLKHIADARAAVEMLTAIYGTARNLKSTRHSLKLLDCHLNWAEIQASEL